MNRATFFALVVVALSIAAIVLLILGMTNLKGDFAAIRTQIDGSRHDVEETRRSLHDRVDGIAQRLDQIDRKVDELEKRIPRDVRSGR